ncbi:hypothetical protein BDV11DRAFT_142148 [Aspergillus similis]
MSKQKLTAILCQRNCPAPASGAPRGTGAPRGGFGGGFRGGYGGYPRAATCYKCGGPNHFARDCQAQAMKCYACGKLVSATYISLCRLNRANIFFRVTSPATARLPTAVP